MVFTLAAAPCYPPFAPRHPYLVHQGAKPYAKLRAFGQDPTNGSLQAIVDTMAASGGGAEQMEGIVLALGQAWTKQKLQGEEAMQLLERGVPVWDLLAQKTGKNAAELMEMASAGKLGRAEINLLIEAMGQRNAGASEEMSKTWGGITSNLMDYWTRFQRMVMDAGLFDFMKGKSQALLTFLEAAAADGRLQAWATTTPTTILSAMTTLERFGIWLHDTWVAVWPVLDQVAQAVGGWDVVGWAVGFLLFKSVILSAFSRLGMVLQGVILLKQAFVMLLPPLVRIAWFLTGKLVVGAVLGLEAAMVAAGRAAVWLGRAFLIAGRLLLANLQSQRGLSLGQTRPYWPRACLAVSGARCRRDHP